MDTELLKLSSLPQLSGVREKCLLTLKVLSKAQKERIKKKNFLKKKKVKQVTVNFNKD